MFPLSSPFYLFPSKSHCRHNFNVNSSKASTLLLMIYFPFLKKVGLVPVFHSSRIINKCQNYKCVHFYSISKRNCCYVHLHVSTAAEKASPYVSRRQKQPHKTRAEQQKDMGRVTKEVRESSVVNS